MEGSGRMAGCLVGGNESKIQHCLFFLRYTKVLGYWLADNRKCCFIESDGLLIKSL